MNSNLELLTYKDVPLFSFDGLKTYGKVVHAIDGDTIHVIMLYNNNPIKLDCRLFNIDTPEMTKTPEIAKRARNRLLQLCTDCTIDLNDMCDKKTINKYIENNKKIITIDCLGEDKYGRELVNIYSDNGELSVNDILINEGYAHKYTGGKKETW